LREKKGLVVTQNGGKSDMVELIQVSNLISAHCSACGEVILRGHKRKKTTLCYFYSCRRNGLNRSGKKRVKKNDVA